MVLSLLELVVKDLQNAEFTAVKKSFTTDSGRIQCPKSSERGVPKQGNWAPRVSDQGKGFDLFLDVIKSMQNRWGN